MSLGLPKTMRAVVYRGANDLRLEEVPTPKILAGELLVKVAVCGVCPTDIKKIQHATVPPPRIFGHETSGTIVRVGRNVRGWKEGDRVGLHHHVPCMRCHFCAHKAFAQCPTYKRTGITAGFEPAGGGYAEYVRVMPFVLPGVVKIPRGNSFLEGAMLEPVNTALKGIEQLGLLKGDWTLVTGQGPIGLVFTRLLSASGINVIATDMLPFRLQMARKMGARKALLVRDENLGEITRQQTKGRGLDAAIIAVPSDQAFAQAYELLRGGGRALLFAHTKRGAGAEVDLSTICVDEKELLGSYSSDVTLQRAVARLVFSRTVDVSALVTHRFSLERTAEAIALAASPAPDSLKVVVDVSEDGDSH